MKTFGFNAPNQYGFGSGQGLGFIGSQSAALILYSDINGTFVYQTRADGTRTIDNKGRGGFQYDGLLNTGRGVELGATNDLPIPVHYTTTEQIDSSFYVGGSTSSCTVNGERLEFNAIGDGYYYKTLDIGSPNEYVVTYDIENYVSGEVYIVLCGLDATPPSSGNGTYTEIIKPVSITADNRPIIRVFDSSGFVGDVVNLSIAQVTSNENSYLTYHDIANDEIIQLGNAVDGGSSKELAPDINIQDPNSWTTTGDIEVGVITLENGQYAHNVMGESISATQAYIDIQGSGNAYVKVDGGSSTLVSLPYIGAINVSTGEIGRAYITAATGGCTVTYYSVKEILPTSTEYILNDVTVNNILTHKMPFSAGDLTLIQQEPNLLAALAMGEATPISSVTLDADDSWYACGEVSGAYVVDQRAGYGVEQIDDPSFDNGTTNWTPTIGTSWSVSGGQLVSTDTGGGDARVINSSTILAGKICVVTHIVSSSNGGVIVVSGGTSPFGNVNIEIGNTVGTHSLILPSVIDGGFMLTTFTGTEWYGTIDNISVREATASEIANYTDTIRTNVDQSPYGIQWTCAELDGAGVPTAYTDTELMVYDNDYIDTQWTPDAEEYSIEETVTGELQDFGSDILGGLDFTNWIAANANATIVDSNNFTTSAINSGVFKTGLGLVENSWYVFRISGTTTSTKLELRDGGVTGVIETILSGGGDFYVEISIQWTSSNPNPLIWNIEIGDTRIDSMTIHEATTKTQRTEQRLLTHTDVKLGDELITNGTFDTDTGWNKNANWTISGGTANSDGTSSSSINQSTFQAEAGKTYYYSFDVVSIVDNGGNYSLQIGNTLSVIAYAVGTYSGTLVAELAGQNTKINAHTSAIGSIDNVVIKEVSTENKYYIDGLEQDVTPPLPDDTTTLKLTNTAVIGYEDTIDEINYFRVSEKIIEP